MWIWTQIQIRKASSKVIKRILLYLRQFWPPYLRAEIRDLNEMIICRDAAILKYIRQNQSKPDEQTARAMLMQLRVHQESVRHRTGYMVSAFIADGVIERLKILTPEYRAQFQTVVAEALVSNALAGIYKRSQATGKLTALIFEPISKRGQNVKLVGGIFETDNKPEFVSMSNGPISNKRITDVII